MTRTSSSADAWKAEVVSIRDTVESIGIAIVMAFLLRAFLVEAFVIPTGSMAPRLMGEHYNLLCPHCGWEYDHGHHVVAGIERGRKYPPAGATCPNCRRAYAMDDVHRAYVDGGDRVLVIKYLYNFIDPKPWDVIVFRNPQNNRENFIKRLVGLPGETLEIVRGDLWVKRPGSDTWAIRRKPHHVQKAMWQIVHDSDYPLVDPFASQAPPRWIAPTDDDGRWDLTSQHTRRMRFKGGDRGTIVFDGADGAFFPFYGYNKRDQVNSQIRYQYNYDICSDLKLSLVFTPGEADSRVAMVFDVMDQRLAADISADGVVRLWQQSRRPADGADGAAGERAAQWFADGQWTLWERGSITPLQPGRGYELALTNVDFRLTLRIDGEVVLESTDRDYPADYATVKARLIPQMLADNPLPDTKVAISAGGGPSDLLHLRLSRDVYYTEVPHSRPHDTAGQYARDDPEYQQFREAWDAKPGWAVTGNPIKLDDDSFFVLGDNSPYSLDSRRWIQAAPTLRLYETGPDGKKSRRYQLGTVPRYNIIGKAVFVYWPAGLRVPGMPNLPLVPNVGKMRFIR